MSSGAASSDQHNRAGIVSAVRVLSSFANGTLFGAREGETPAHVLALHGWRKDNTDLQKVTEGFDAITLDLPGFGSSPEPTSVWGAKEYAEAVEPVLREMARPLVIVGHSFGGRIALQLAANHPNAIDALVLTGTPLLRKKTTAKKPAFLYRAIKFANRTGVLSDARLEQVRRKRGSADYRAASGVMRDVFVRLVNESYEQQLREVQCHVELVWGENDTEAPLAIAKEAAQLINDVDMTTVPGGSHWLPTEFPLPIREAINKCLR